jgi:hypothetical protein
MSRMIFLTAIASLIVTVGAQADDFYFGGMTNQVYRFQNIGDNEAGEADAIKEELGFNLLFGCGPKSAELIKLGTDQGFYTFPSMYRADGTTADDYRTLNSGNYAMIEAEDSEHEVRFGYNIGTDTSGFVYGPLGTQGQPITFLADLSYRHRTYKDDEFWFTYTMRIVMRPAAGRQVDEGDPVGFLMLNSDTIKTVTYSISDTGITVAETDTLIPQVLEQDNIKIGTYQNCEFGVDWFKVYNDVGRLLVEQHQIEPSILDFAEDYTDTGNVVYWYFHDEPRYTQFMPDGAWRAVFNNNNLQGASVFSHNVGEKIPREYVEYGNPEILFCDIYPLKGGQICSTFTYEINYQTGDTLDYYLKRVITGNKTAYWGNDSTSAGWDLQKVIDDYYVDYLDTLYTVAHDNGRDFWVLSQAFKQSFKDLIDTSCVEIDESGDTLKICIDDRDCEDDVAYIWRTPTRSELSALTFIAMCYPIKGLVYWRYDSTNDPDQKADGITEYDGEGDWVPSVLWGYLEDYISPYVKAYGDLYASQSFSFDRTYKVNDSTDPPSGALLESIDYWSDSTNPDSGWFQVGEFHDSSGDDYVMLINRACNVDSSTLAPDVNVVVRFDTAAFDSDYLYVINLADTAYYDPVSPGGWQAIPDTTYTAAFNGTIPFTTVLGPGEGRLFKIVGTSKRDLTYYDDELSSNEGR